MAMKIEDVLKVIYDLSHSQGHWGRLYMDLCEMRDEDPDTWERYVETIESEEFETTLDVVLYYEEGKHHRKLSIEEQVDEIITEHVSVYERADYSDTVYIYNDLAYIGETGYDNMVEQIKEDYDLNDEEEN